MSDSSASSSKAASPAPNSSDQKHANLPTGHCRYILLNPEIKGQRCACVGFTLNRSLPGVSCQCGHLSCFHIKSLELPPERSEIEDLRRRLQLLEGQLDRENETGIGGALASVVQRLGDLEEHFETNKAETTEEMQNCYRNVNRMWVAVGELDKKQALMVNQSALYGDRLGHHTQTLEKLDNRIMELDEATISLEERVEVLEDLPSSRHTGTSPSSTSPMRPTVFPSRGSASISHPPIVNPRPRLSQNLSGGGATTPAGGPWTVHVSLLPTAKQPFPFEKDTNAYKRCLSRGLHQMIAVSGTDSNCFTDAITKHFGKLLQGKSWVPLQARLCDAVTLEGLPMLRPLDPSLVGRPWDLDFLREHCAVCHPNGKAESLYIAMLEDTFSWHFLRRSPVYLEGLEDSWEYDALLDPDPYFFDDTDGEEDRLAAGEIMPLQSSLKRTASEMSRAASFSTAEGSESRPKLARTCLPVEVRRRGVETI
ncbi:hypothetical protein F5Y16DRAFT_405517 [Xylariaceae sp. FL0255]|nr:hypothetical protein F5Y16DRAFT_405517 [Xylariaceae sp. FL0255]